MTKPGQVIPYARLDVDRKASTSSVFIWDFERNNYKESGEPNSQEVRIHYGKSSAEKLAKRFVDEQSIAPAAGSIALSDI